MTTRKLSDLQAHIIAHLPAHRGQVAYFCANDGYHESSAYRAINTLLRRGLITIDDSGMVRRNEG